MIFHFAISACIDEDVKAWCPGYKEFCKSNIYVRMYCKKTCETCKYVGGNTGNNHGNITYNAKM